MKKIAYIIFSLLISFELFSQENDGSLRGIVFNRNNNEPVTFANIVIYQTNIGLASDIDGNFLLKGIKPGFIKLQVSAVGYKTYISEEIMVTNAKIAFIEIPLEETSISLNEVVIKPSPFRKTEESPLSLRKISIKDIERSPGANRDISKVIQSFPGVASTPVQRNDVIVRGGGPGENTFYLDGVEIPNINHFSTQGASGGPVGIINVDFIREVDFFSSAFPANKGNALSSVLEFKQKDGNKEKLEVQGTIGASEVALTLDGPVMDNSSFIFSARRSYLQLLFKALELPFLPIYNDFQFKSKTKINNKNEITIIGLGAIDQFELNLDANETEAQQYILNYIPVNEQWTYTLGLVYKHYKEKSYGTWVLSRNTLNNSLYKYQDNIEVDSLLTFDYKSEETETKARYENTLRTKNGYKINYGAGIKYAEYSNNTFNRLFVGLEPVTINYNSDFSLWGWSLFAQTSKEFYNNKLVASLGIRSDANSYSSGMSNLLKQISPRFSLSYKLSQLTSVNLSAGRFFQQPSYTTLGYRDGNMNLVNKENGLKYIQADHLVGGIQFLPGEQSIITLEGFYKYYSNYPFSLNDSISLANKGADYGTFGDEEVLSVSEGRAYGLELLYRHQNLWGFNVVLSYTLVNSEFKKMNKNLQPVNEYIPTSWDNKHLLNLTATKNLKNNWQVGFKWRFVGGSPYTPFDEEKSSFISAWNARGREYPDFTKLNSKRLDSFHQLDIRIDKQYFFNKWSLMLYIDIQNVYNFKSDEPDRLITQKDSNGNLILEPDDPSKYDLKTIESDGSGTILPSIGLIVQF